MKTILLALALLLVPAAARAAEPPRPDTAGWYADALPQDGAPVDLSFLNDKPAGVHGRVGRDGSNFRFADGTPVRFWGATIAAYAIETRKPYIKLQAHRIAALGYNLIRIHHHDSMAWVGGTVIDQNQPDSQHLSPKTLDALDYWIYCLKQEGVYVWLDLHVGRLFKPGDNIGEGYAEMVAHGNGKDKATKGVEAKGYNYFDDRVTELMQQFNDAYLNHVNRYTGLAYKDDPAVMGLLLTNENDITHHFGNLMLGDKGNPVHHARFAEAAAAFAKKTGLDANSVTHTWEPGPAKLFLADREWKWDQRMIAALRANDVHDLVATTSLWGNDPLVSLPSLLAGDMVDVHSYGSDDSLKINPLKRENLVSYTAGGAAAGYPVTMTEWNIFYPKPDRFIGPLYYASVSALQGWDGPMIYNYSQGNFFWSRRPDVASTYTDPSISGLMPAAALMYRRGDVAEAKKVYRLQLTEQELYYKGAHPKNMAALRTLTEQSRVEIGIPNTKELPWDEDLSPLPAAGTEVVTDMDKPFLPPEATSVASDTGELKRDWAAGWQSIDTPRTQAALGNVGGVAFKFKASTIALKTAAAAVAVSSLDGKPIGQSNRVLLTAVGRSVASADGNFPMLSEPIAGTVTVKGPPGMKLVPLEGNGRLMPAVDVPFADGAYAVTLPAPRGTHWFLLIGGA